MSKQEHPLTSILICAKMISYEAQYHTASISSNVKYRDTFCLSSLANEPWNTFADVDPVIISNMAIKSY